MSALLRVWGFFKYLWRSSAPYNRLVAYLLWFAFWFGPVGVRSPFGVFLVLFFNPFLLFAAYSMWVNRDGLLLSYEYLRSFWRVRRLVKEEKKILEGKKK